MANFSQRFGSIRSVGPARLEREQLWRSPISPAENLWYLGLLYRGFEQLPNGAMREVFFAPAELAPLLPLLKAPDRSVEPLEIAAAPTDIRSSGEALADDLCTLLSHLHNNFVRSSDPADCDRRSNRCARRWPRNCVTHSPPAWSSCCITPSARA